MVEMRSRVLTGHKQHGRKKFVLRGGGCDQPPFFIRSARKVSQQRTPYQQQNLSISLAERRNATGFSAALPANCATRPDPQTARQTGLTPNPVQGRKGTLKIKLLTSSKPALTGVQPRTANREVDSLPPLQTWINSAVRRAAGSEKGIAFGLAQFNLFPTEVWTVGKYRHTE